MAIATTTQAGTRIAPGKGGLVAFPPEFKTMPCKPLYFDLAGNYLVYPSLDERIATLEAEQQTALGAAAGMLTGAVGGALGKLGGWWGGGQ
jgi:signal recognition particle subunit SRP68